MSAASATALRLLALDPSITAFGWCAIELRADAPTGHVEPRLLAAGVLETQPLSAAKRKAQHVSVTEDDARRVRFLRREFVAVFQRYAPAVVAIEGGAGSTNAKTAKMLGQAQALAVCVVDQCLDGSRAIYVTPSTVDAALGIARLQRAASAAGPARTKGAKDAKGTAPASSRTRKEISAELDDMKRRLADLGKSVRDPAAFVDVDQADALTRRADALEAELEALRAAARKSKDKRDARKLAIASAVVERLGLRAWVNVFGSIGCTTDEQVRERVMHPRFEGAHDAAGIALAVLDHPIVTALRAMAQPTPSATERAARTELRRSI